MPAHCDMQVWSRRPASSSAQANLLSFLDFLAFAHLDVRQVHVQGHELLAVIDDDAITFIEQFLRQHHSSCVRRKDGRAFLGVIIRPR